MSATVTPLATSARGKKKLARVERRDADIWLKREHPELSRSARENLAAAVPTIQRNNPEESVWDWLDSAAKLTGLGFRFLTRGENPTMRAGLRLARKPELADQFDRFSGGDER